MQKMPYDDDIIKLYHQGFKNTEIAEKLGIHRETVRTRLSKFGLKSKFRKKLEMVDATHAKCSKCFLIKELNEFPNYPHYKTKKYYRLTYCFECRLKQENDRINEDIDKYLSIAFFHLKKRAMKNNVPFSISKEEYIDQYNAQNGLCFYTDEKMICVGGKGKHRNGLSTDKIIPSKGYVKGNVVLCTNKINLCKNDLSLDEISLWMPSWYIRIMKFIKNE